MVARSLRWVTRGTDEIDCCRCYVAVPGMESSPPPKPALSLRAAAVLASFSALLAAAVTAFTFTARGAPGAVPTAFSAYTEPLTAAPTAAARERAHRREQLFSELTAQEVRAVARFAASGLGCATKYDTAAAAAAALRSCFLSGSESVRLWMPEKRAALAHLDGDGPPPLRTAQVIVVHGDKPVAEGVGIYQVGPLNGNGGLAVDASIRLTRSLHFNRRPLDMGDTSCDTVTTKVVRQLQQLLLASFGHVFKCLPESFKPQEAGQLYVLYAPAVTSTLQHRATRVVFNWFRDPEQFQINWMHPLPFTFDIVQVGDVEDWIAENVTYCGQMFKGVDALLDADHHRHLRRCSMKPATEYSWDVPGPDPGTAAASKVPAPMHSVPVTWHLVGRGGILWGDWELLATVRPSSGLSLHDIRWRGKRILYELGMSDAHAYYTSALAEKQFHYSDKAFSLSQLSGDMVLGLDCPEGATLLEGTIWMLTAGVAIISDPAAAKPAQLACVFESNGFEGSLWRHTQLLSRRVSGRPAKQLVVRAVSTVGNYDYIAEVRFAEDGSIHVRNDFAGYPETDHAAPYRDPPATPSGLTAVAVGWPDGAPVQLDWGNRVRGDLVAQLHSHFCVWKVDLDILGEGNEFHVTRASVAQDGAYNKKVLKTLRVEREDPDVPLVASAIAPSLWRIVNSNAPNPSTGTARGYAILIESGPAVQTLPPGHPFTITGSFAKRHLAVARRKEEEDAATHSLDHYPITDPLLSVDRFLTDREDLTGQDLICWVSVGKEHVTRSEDVPLVSNFGVGFTLAPWNYHEENPAMQLPMVKN